MVALWYEQGADPANWPKCQQDKDDWSRLIVADQYGCKYFEGQPVSVRVEDAFMAWGSGRDFAIAAMYLGKSAQDAVAIACLFVSGCGNGVDVISLR